jgi:hypothetical protein
MCQSCFSSCLCVPEPRFWGRGEKNIWKGLLSCGVEEVASCGDVPEGTSLMIGSFQWDIHCELWEAAIFIPKLAALLCIAERVDF